MLCIAINYRTAHCRREVFLPCSLERLLPPKEKAFPTMPFDEAEEERGDFHTLLLRGCGGERQEDNQDGGFPLAQSYKQLPPTGTHTLLSLEDGFDISKTPVIFLWGAKEAFARKR